MVTTKKLYETDPYCRVFRGKVLSCEEKNGSFYTALDQTAFFPEGGGQRADEGTLGGEAVTDVSLKDGVILHETKRPFAVGDSVEGVISWEKRFKRMQSHAGEHILSGVVHRLFGYNNVGFHMNDQVMTVDFDGPLTGEDVARIEREANRAVWANTPIRAYYPSEEELAALSYRSKTEHKEPVRIVCIEGADICACCAPHPSETGQIGLIKIVSFAPYKKGTRTEVLAGEDAFSDYMNLNDKNKSLMGLYSATREGVLSAAEKEHAAYLSLKGEHQRLLKELALSKLSPVRVGKGMYAFFEGLSFDELRYLANTLIARGETFVSLISLNGEDGALYVFASLGGDVRETVKKINESFGGRGGGKPEYAQGTAYLADKEKLTIFLEEALASL